MPHVISPLSTAFLIFSVIVIVESRLQNPNLLVYNKFVKSWNP